MRIIIYILFLCIMPVMGFGQIPQLKLNQASIHCDSLYDKGINFFQGGKYEEAYSYHKKYIENCAQEKRSGGVFSRMSTANYVRSKDDSRFPEFREWLKKVVYYNLDSNYYCEDVASIIKTFGYFDSIRGNDALGAIAIVKYLKQEGKCSYYYDYWDQASKESMEYLVSNYRDTVKDSLKTPLDTTLPSLEGLDLEILRGPNQGVVAITREPRLRELIATRNPFADILELKYRLDKSAMVRIDVYDLLGRAVYSEGQGYKAEGEHVLSLQPEGWASGSYYVRLSSPSGEVKTVKVVKE
jgi:hypothetical protein